MNPPGDFKLCFQKIVSSARELATSLADARPIRYEVGLAPATRIRTHYRCTGVVFVSVEGAPRRPSSPYTMLQYRKTSDRWLGFQLVSVSEANVLLRQGTMKRKGPSRQDGQRSLTDFFCPPAKRATSTIEPAPSTSDTIVIDVPDSTQSSESQKNSSRRRLLEQFINKWRPPNGHWWDCAGSNTFPRDESSLRARRLAA